MHVCLFHVQVHDIDNIEGILENKLSNSQVTSCNYCLAYGISGGEKGIRIYTIITCCCSLGGAYVGIVIPDRVGLVSANKFFKEILQRHPARAHAPSGRVRPSGARLFICQFLIFLAYWASSDQKSTSPISGPATFTCCSNRSNSTANVDLGEP